MSEIANRRSRSPEDKELLVVIGRQIRILREARGLTIIEFVDDLKAQFGNVSGFNVASLTASEKGLRALSPYRLLCVAKYFDIPTTRLFGRDVLDRERECLAKP
jgi:transcriptional regulator with XRE-family HTH domain